MLFGGDGFWDDLPLGDQDGMQFADRAGALLPSDPDYWSGNVPLPLDDNVEWWQSIKADWEDPDVLDMLYEWDESLSRPIETPPEFGWWVDPDTGEMRP